MSYIAPNLGGPEQRDAPVTVLFTPYTPERRFALDGFDIEYGCGHRPEPLCRNRPVYLVDTNVATAAACEEHLLEVLERAILEAQRLGGDRDDSPGFLHAVAPTRRRIELPLVAYDDRQVVFSKSLDHRYKVEVFRATEDPQNGVLVVSEQDRPPFLEQTVHLMGCAAYGVDISDVAEWQQIAVEAVDGRKSMADRLADALSRRESHESELRRAMRTSTRVMQVFEKALEAFANADAAVAWMVQPNAALQRKTPIETLAVDTRLQEVLDLIDKIRSWDLRMTARAKAYDVEQGQ